MAVRTFDRAMTSILTFLAAVISRLWGGVGRVSPLSYLWVCTLVQVLLWRRLPEIPLWPGRSLDLLSVLVVCLATMGLCFFADRIVVRSQEAAAPIFPVPTTSDVTPEVVPAAMVAPVIQGAHQAEDRP